MKTFKWTAALFCSLMLIASSLPAQEADHAGVMAAFAKLLANGKSAFEQGITAGTEAQSAAKFEIDSVTIPNTNVVCQCGIKVWFQLENGTYVNPRLHKWQRQERFKVFILTPVPAYVALFQNYPEDRPPSRQVYPDQRYPNSFCAVPPGVPTCLPVMFRMDNDLRDEIMSMVVTRVDDTRIAPPVIVRRRITERPAVQENNVVVVNQNTGSGTLMSNVTVEGSAKTYDYLAEINKQARSADRAKNAGQSAKFEIVSASTVVSSAVPDEVAVFALGVGKSAQVQFTLKKD